MDAILTSPVRAAYRGSSGKATLDLFARLLERGPDGELACLLFRAQKNSSRAKTGAYRYGRDAAGQRFAKGAYERKGESLEALCRFLTDLGCDDGSVWGWKIDRHADRNQWVLYVETPQGQCSFHSPTRYAGPDFSGEWDRANSEETVLRFCEEVLA